MPDSGWNALFRVDWKHWVARKEEDFFSQKIWKNSHKQENASKTHFLNNFPFLQLVFSYFLGEDKDNSFPIFLFRAGGPKTPFQQADRPGPKVTKFSKSALPQENAQKIDLVNFGVGWWGLGLVTRQRSKTLVQNSGPKRANQDMNYRIQERAFSSFEGA